MLPILSKGRVLVLDDDAAMQRLVSTLLRREGYAVTTVDSGRKAIEALKKKRFDALLLDLMMPHEGGMTVIRHLREHDEAALKRVILFTATPATVLKSLQKDIAAVVRKPFEPADLIDAVKRIAG